MGSGNSFFGGEYAGDADFFGKKIEETEADDEGDLDYVFDPGGNFDGVFLFSAGRNN